MVVNFGVTNGIVNNLALPTTISDNLIFSLRTGVLYFNIYTEEFPDGEIRGQIYPSSIFSFHFFFLSFFKILLPSK